MPIFGGNKKLTIIHSLAVLGFILLLIFTYPCLKGKKTGLSSFQKEAETIPLKEVKPINLADDFSNYIYKNYPLLFQYCPYEAIEMGLSGYDFQFQAQKADLNNDSQDEYFIFPVQVCGQDVRGASGNGPISVYQKTEAGWEIIAEIEGSDIVVFEQATDGYYNFRSHVKLSADSGYTTIYQYFKNREEHAFKYFPVSQEWYYY